MQKKKGKRKGTEVTEIEYSLIRERRKGRESKGRKTAKEGEEENTKLIRETEKC